MYLYYHHHIHAVSRMTLFFKKMVEIEKKNYVNLYLFQSEMASSSQIPSHFDSTFFFLELHWNVKLLLHIQLFFEFFITLQT